MLIFLINKEFRNFMVLVTASIGKTPLHTLPLSHLTLTGEGKEKALSFLGREIALYYGGVDQKAIHVVTTVGEIYRKCHKTLSEEFGPTRLIMRGSSVSQLFSAEPFSDIDIHATIDVTDLPEQLRVGKGYGFKWALLKGISEIVSEKLPLDRSGSRILIPSTEILYKEETNLLCSKGAPFNVHTIRLPGDVPLEFTIFNIVKEVTKSQRNYDFNAGSLELSIEDNGDITLYSITPDIQAVIEELKLRALTCHAPDEIERKAICRYLAKLVISGYYDKDKELLCRMLESVQKRNPGKENKFLAKGVIEEIVAHFKEKRIDPSAPLLTLWLLVAEHPFLKIVIAEVKEALKGGGLADYVPGRKALFTLVQRGKKAESCWYLLMQSKSARRVVHRGEDSLQLEIPAFPLFADSEVKQSVFIIIPIVGLEKFSESVIPQDFIDLHQDVKPLVQVEGQEIKGLIQKICQDVLIKAPLYPVLSCVIDRFGMENQTDFSKLFIEWISLNDQLPEPKKLKIPLQFLRNLQPTVLKAIEDPSLFIELEEILEGRSLHPLSMFSMLKMFYLLVGKKGLCSFESVRLQRVITCFTWGFFLKREAFGLLSRVEEEMMLDFAKAHVQELCKIEKLLAYKRMSENVIPHRTLSILHSLYVKDLVGLSKGSLGVRLNFELGNLSEGVKFLEILVKKELTLTANEIQSLFEELSISYPFEYASFLKENGYIIGKKTEAFSLIIMPFLQKLLARKLSPDLISKFIEALESICKTGEKEQIIKSLFKEAAKRNPQSQALLEEGKKRFKLSAVSFYWISEMDKEELNFLSEQEGFASLFESNPHFTTQIFDQAILRENPSLATLGSFYLSKTDPDRCLTSIYRLNTLQKSSSDFTTLPPSLKVLVRLLNFHPTLRGNERLQQLIGAGLEVLSVYLASSDGETFETIDEEFFTNLQEFHRLMALDTLESPAWPLLWKRVERMGKNKAIKDWVNLADLAKTVGSICPTGNILKLIGFFDLDGPFVYELARLVESLSAERQELLAPAVLISIQKGTVPLLATAPKEPPSEARSVIRFVLKTFKASDIADLRTLIDERISYSSFWAAYSDRNEELHILLFLEDLYQEKYDKAVSDCKNKSQIRRILFFFVRRAIERKDFSRLSEIKTFYDRWRLQATFDLGFFSDDRDFPCTEFKGALDELFSDPVKNKAFPLGAIEFKVLEFYSMFLADAVKKYALDRMSAMTPLQVSIKKECDLRILELIQFLTRKKTIKSIFCLNDLSLSILLNYDRELLQLLAPRLVNMSIDTLGDFERYPIQQEDFEAFHKMLITVVEFILMAEGDNGVFFVKRVVPRKSIIKLLEKARTIIPYFIGDANEIKKCFHRISLLEACLNKEEMIAYHSQWAQSILERKESFKIGELSLWIVLTHKVDRVNSHKTSEGFYRKYFLDKFFICEDYFMNPVVIETFIDIIGLGCKKLYEPFPVKNNIEDILAVNVFLLVQRYHHYLRNGISKIRRTSPTKASHLVKGIINHFLTYLMTPKHRCDFSIIGALTGYIVILNEGRVSLFIPKGFVLSDVINMMYWIIHNIPLLELEESEYVSFEEVKEFLKTTYENNTEKIHEVLSGSQIEEFQSLIYNLRGGAAPGGAASTASKSHPK